MGRIHVCLNCQLGNCLRNIASMAILADHIGVEWDIDLAQSISSARVNQVIEALFPGRVTRRRMGSYPLLHERELLRFVDLYGTNSHPLVEAVVRKPPREFGMHHIYAFRPSSMTDGEYLRRKLAFYQTIAVPSALLKEARQFETAQAGGTFENVIGCHIRHTDNLHDLHKRALNLNTPIAAFINRLRQLEEAAIFLCTDNPAVKKAILRAAPGARIFLPNIYSKDPHLWQSLYEMRLLGQTARLIGSMSSTFSYEACFWRGIDLEIFRNNRWHCHQITPHCRAQSAHGGVFSLDRASAA